MTISARVAEHAAAFNAAVRSGDFSGFGRRFTDGATMRFVGVPAGPFVGRDAIAAAYAAQPPTDTLTVREVTSTGDTDTVGFDWDGGGRGTMVLRWDGRLVADLTVAFAD